MQVYSLLCIFYLCLVILECLPVDNNKYARQIPSDKELKFMKKYGYLVDDNGLSEAIYSEENLSRIIKNLQKFGAIEETGLIDNATLQLMSSPRCGVPDILPHRERNKRFAIVEGWNKRHITYFISNWSPNLGEHIVAKNIQKALDIWGGYARLTFTRSPSPDADIIVAFGRGYHGDRYPFDGPGMVLAHAFFPGNSEGPTAAGDIHFDDDENWMDFSSEKKESDRDGTDFFTVALHELGHSLGLSHSEVPTSVMFPYYKGWDQNYNSLDYDDIMGMYNLYIQRRLEDDDDSRRPVYPDPQTTTTQKNGIPPQEPENTTPASYPGSTTLSWKRRKPWDRPRRPPTTELPRRSSTEFSENRTILYEGDDESVEVHKNHDPHRNTPENNSPSLPYICHGHFDAVATLRGELFIFKDQYLWRLKEQGLLLPGYPTMIKQMFPELPEDVKKIDAAYQRPDGSIVLFAGKKLWIFDGSRFVENSPLNLDYFGLPDYLDGIDAVQNWAKNGKTYFYKNDRFWRYDEKSKSMDPGYPMEMGRWRGVPTDLDAATTWIDGTTYFFKGDLYWKFDNDWINIADNSPLPIAPIWLGCKEEEGEIRRLFGP